MSASKNGVAKQSTTATTKKESTVIKMQDETLKKLVLFEETVSKVNELQKLVDDYSKISDTLKGLAQFKGGSGESTQFSISDLSSDAQFVTYNSALITMVIASLTEKLKTKQTELIDRILNFEM